MEHYFRASALGFFDYKPCTFDEGIFLQGLVMKLASLANLCILDKRNVV